jgi:hypothetical protein
MRRWMLPLLWTALAVGQTNSISVVEENYVVCGNGISTGDCRFSRQVVELSLKRLRSAVSQWRFVIVRADLWPKLCEDFKARTCAPAFTLLNLRTTYLTSSLTFNDGRIDEYLQTYTKLTGQERLDWVMSHELGHILCRTANEKDAESTGGKLRFSNNHDRGCKPVLNQDPARP